MAGSEQFGIATSADMEPLRACLGMASRGVCHVEEGGGREEEVFITKR